MCLLISIKIKQNHNKGTKFNIKNTQKQQFYKMYLRKYVCKHVWTDM